MRALVEFSQKIGGVEDNAFEIPCTGSSCGISKALSSLPPIFEKTDPALFESEK